MQRLTLEEAKELLLINKNGLDEVCITQAQILDDISDRVVGARSQRDEVKAELEELSASLSLKYRKTAEDAGEKITEGKITAKIQSDDGYKKCSQRLFDLRNESELWENKKQSFLQRASMIKLLCELYLAGYYERGMVSGNRNTADIAAKGARARLTAARD